MSIIPLPIPKEQQLRGVRREPRYRNEDDASDMLSSVPATVGAIDGAADTLVVYDTSTSTWGQSTIDDVWQAGADAVTFARIGGGTATIDSQVALVGTALNAGAIAIGDEANAGDAVDAADCIAIGTGASAGSAGTAVNGGATAVGSQSAAEGEGACAIGNDSIAGGSFSSSMGTWGRATGDYSCSLGGANANGDYCVAAGDSAYAGSKSLGYESSVAVGPNCRSDNTYAAAFGSFSRATGEFSTAVGTSDSLGDATEASGAVSCAFGYASKAFGINSVALGVATHADGLNSTSIGQYNNTLGVGGDDSIAVGDLVEATGLASIAIGMPDVTNRTTASGINSIAIGKYSRSQASNTIAIGWNTNAAANYDCAIGANTQATGSLSVAIGGGDLTATAATSSSGAVAVGTFSKALGSSSVSIANASQALNYADVSIGYLSDAAGGGGSAGSGAVAIGESSQALAKNAVSIGYATTNGAAISGDKAVTFYGERSFTRTTTSVNGVPAGLAMARFGTTAAYDKYMFTGDIRVVAYSTTTGAYAMWKITDIAGYKATGASVPVGAAGTVTMIASDGVVGSTWTVTTSFGASNTFHSISCTGSAGINVVFNAHSVYRAINETL